MKPIILLISLLAVVSCTNDDGGAEYNEPIKLETHDQLYGKWRIYKIIESQSGRDITTDCDLKIVKIEFLPNNTAITSTRNYNFLCRPKVTEFEEIDIFNSFRLNNTTENYENSYYCDLYPDRLELTLYNVRTYNNNNQTVATSLIPHPIRHTSIYLKEN